MKIKVVLSVISVLLILTACFGQETLRFEGESDDWKVRYVTDIASSKDAENGTIQMRYLGDSEAPNQIYYSIKSGSSDMSGEATMEEGYLEIDGIHCSGCLVTKEDAEFDMTIEWDDKSESLILKNID